VDEENIKAGKEFEKTIGYRRVIKRVCQAEDIEKFFFRKDREWRSWKKSETSLIKKGRDWRRY
jgi:hypothetical protein